MRIAGFVTVLVLAAAPARADRADTYVSLALQGSLEGARALFGPAGRDTLSARERTCRDRFESRILRGDEPLPLPEDPFAAGVVRIYRDYWRHALLGRVAPERAERFLVRRLRVLAARTGVADRRDDPFESMGAGLAAAGLHHLGGITLPHFELMLWARQDTTQYDVQLTDGPQQATVVFVGDFLVRGWAEFATFGRASTGGWATRDALFCLVDDYDLESERFLVSYLKHEARHFADYRLFPELQQIDLEYRGKLTEAAFAETTLAAVLATFARHAAPNPEAPHSFANDAAIRDLSEAVFGEELVADEARWQAADRAAVHRAARELLERNTAELTADGAATTRGVVWKRPAATSPP